MKKILNSYLSSFAGLSSEVWWLALITLINRAGTMVIPFLSLYLTQNLGFTLENVGTIMTSFGLGSLFGAWAGGKLTDKIGYYHTMVGSLFLTGILFISVQFLEGLWPICICIFLLMTVADAFRPASYVALSAYSKPENKTRSVTLIRLAINLGFSAGPALGGILISSVGYGGLFYADGGTCILASILLLAVLNPKRAKVTDTLKIVENPKSAYFDGPYILFIICMIMVSFAFVQYFSTVPIFYKEVHSLSELEIGILMALNGFTIFLLEMPLIKCMESKAFSQLTNVLFGLALIGLSFFVLNLFENSSILVAGMLLMTFGEMIAFPFSNAFAMKRATRGKQGEYLALYTIAFSIAHVFAHNLGMKSIAKFGFETTWYTICLVCVVGIGLLAALNKSLNRKKAILE